MAKEKTPMDFDAILKEEAERYNLGESKLRTEVLGELTAQVAKKIVERVIAGELAPPKTPKKRPRLALGR